MAQHQPIFQTKPEEHSVQIPVNIERDSTTLVNPNRKPNHWPTILLSTIFVIIAILLENFYYEQINQSEYNKRRQSNGAWTQALLQTVGFPLLILPFIILLTTKKHNNHPPIASDQFHYKSLAVIYICIGILLSVQGRLSKPEISFMILTLISLTQLFFTPIFARFVNKIKFNRWVVISLVFAVVAGALTFTTTFGREPYNAERKYARAILAALFAAVCFSLLLCNIQNVFDSYIFKRTESKPGFASVFEVIVFSSLVATLISMVGLLVAGEQHDLKREMNGFPKGKGSYVMAMVGQAVSWQVYWVGIVGLVFSVSSVLSNVISVVTWPIVSVLVVIFFNFSNFTGEGVDEFDTFKGLALLSAALSVAAYFFRLHKENRDKTIVHIPVYTKQDLITLGNRKLNHWPTIILCIIFVITGQSIAKILETFYYDQTDHTQNRQNDAVWTQSLLQTVGFPLLLPFFIFTAKKHNPQQPPTTSNRTSTNYIVCFSGLIGILRSNQGRFSAKAKLELPFRVFTLIYATQLFFTLVFAAFINKLKLNRWIITSLILATATGALTFSSSFAGEPDEAEVDYRRGSLSALLSSLYFSLLLCAIQNVFKRTEPSFASVYKVLIFSSLVATISAAAGLLIEGEQDGLKKEMNGFSKGKGAYVLAMVGQAVSWQVYWVGIVGLVSSVSGVLANVVSVITWPIVSVLVVFFFGYVNDEFDVFKGVALITASLGAAAYFYRLHEENRNY
ncbi:hypothetical protein Bca52824_031990 [Brassica carinata]|uniref:Purine permease 14 n=1 Tax=Brassica carinata TaxID=52824 RepID=A0A8X7SFZ9_BRACI|nr:hypothetical protein Bca52824_031990 [Brassica carinata]